MSAASSENNKHHGEIIIVRRGGDHEEGHHGGAWKIAFADFMTAMMCFFLVMWLINAANEQTKASVASYFNPVKLVDRNTNPKGLEDIANAPAVSGDKESTANKAESQAAADKAGGAGESQEHSEAAFFADPYAVMNEIAAEPGPQGGGNKSAGDRGAGGAVLDGPADGVSGGDAYRDPFAPDFWTNQVAEVPAAEASAQGQAARADAPAEASATADPAAKPDAPAHAPEKGAPAETGAQVPAPPAEAGTQPSPAPAEAGTQTSPAPAEAGTPPAPTRKAAAEIGQEIAQSFKPGEHGAEDVSVKATDKGVEISVTEGFDFGMFEIGSAVPEKALIAAMDKIGAVLKERGGTVTIKGHTDGRPFHGKGSDNWRLSTSRAHAAFYMLLRAGLDEKRVSAISGVADREPKVPGDPLAAANRRIEILLDVKK